MTPLSPHPFPALVDAEAARVAALHPPLTSHDEALSVLDEEVAEVRAEVYKAPAARRPEALLTELIQVAAVAHRWAAGLGLAAAVGGRFPPMVAAALDLCRRETPPAAGGHEAMTRLARPVLRLWDVACRRGPSWAGGQADAAAALAAVAACCQRWAEDAGLTPPAGPHPVGPQP